MGAFEHFPAQKVLKHLAESEAAIAANSEAITANSEAITTLQKSEAANSEALSEAVTIRIVGTKSSYNYTTIDMTDSTLAISTTDGTDAISFSICPTSKITIPYGTWKCFGNLSAYVQIGAKNDATCEEHALLLTAYIKRYNQICDWRAVYIPKGSTIKAALSGSATWETERTIYSYTQTYKTSASLSTVEIYTKLSVADELSDGETEDSVIGDITLTAYPICTGHYSWTKSST